MGDYGITSKGFVLKRLDEIYSQVCTALKENIGVDPSENPQSILNVLTTIFCDQIASVWEDYSSGYENLFPITAEGVALDRCMQLGGVSRIGKARTTYFLSCTGKEGTIIPAGALVQTSTSPVRQFQCASIGTITIKNWSSLTIQPIDDISGTFTFSFSIERNATSGDVGTVSSSSKVSKKLTVTSYDDAIEKIIAVLQGFKAFESYGISVKTETNEKGQKIIVLNGAKESDCFSSSTCEYVTIVRVTSNILFESVDYGSFIHANNTITKIVTNIDGFESVSNRITPNSGHLEQTDAEARSSYIDRLANRALGTVASIVSILYSDVEGVTYATGYQNDTDETDADGRPPHSIEIVVQGGSDAAVANVIWKNKAAGIRAYGSYYSYATDMNGNSQYLEFTRVKTVYLLLSIKITSAGGLDDDYEERIKALLSNEGLEVGKTIRLQRLIRPILENISGVDYVEIRGALNEKSDVSSVADSSMTAGVVAVSRDLQPLIVANGIRIVKVS